MRLTVIIPTSNSAASLESCLRAVRQEHRGEILVTDASSEDLTERIALEYGARVWRGPEGWGKQRCLGASKALGEVFLFLSVERGLSPGWEEALQKAVRSPYAAGGSYLCAFSLRNIFHYWQVRHSKFSPDAFFVCREAWQAVARRLAGTDRPGDFAKFLISLGAWSLLRDR